MLGSVFLNNPTHLVRDNGGNSFSKFFPFVRDRRFKDDGRAWVMLGASGH